MALPLSVTKLAGNSRRFVFDNFDIFLDHIKIIFPCLLILELVNSFAAGYEAKWIPLLTVLPMFYLYACLALSWHRTSILEPSSAHAINPLNLQPESRKFIKFFMLLSIVPALIAIVYGVFVGIAAGLGSKEVAIGLGLLGVPLFIYMIIYLMRVSFVLPARAIGIDMSIEEAKKASKGLIGRIFLAGFLIGLGYVLVTVIYAFIVGFSAALIFGTEGHSQALLSVGHFLLNVPVLFAGLVVTAITITILSTAFQWRAQNG